MKPLYHHVSLNPDMFGEQELKRIVDKTQEGVPNLEETTLVLGSQRIRTRGALPNPKRIEAWRVTSNGGRWRLEFRLRPSINPLSKTGKAVGIDLGLSNWIITSDDERVPQHPEVVRLTKLIIEQTNQRDHKQTDSSRYRELSRRVERNKQRLYDCQADAANKIAADLVHRYDVIAIEAANAQDKGIQEQHAQEYTEKSELANWKLLQDTIKLRCEEAGKTFVLVPQYYSSQECSFCTYWTKTTMSDRWFVCSHCGYESDRDLNAARTILKRGNELLEGKSQRVKTNWWVPLGHPQYRS